MTDYKESPETKTESVTPKPEGQPETPRGLAAMQGKDAPIEQIPPLKESGDGTSRDVPSQLPSTRDGPGQGDAGDATEKEKLADGFKKLESTQAGQPAAAAIREHGTTIGFGKLKEGDFAQFDPGPNAITINESQKDASSEVLAAHLAHEGTHVQWNRPDSINQEYHAYKAEAEVWNETKGKQSDDQCDAVDEMIAKGEIEAKSEIRQMYTDLPEN